MNSYFISDIYVAQNTSNCGTLIGTFNRSASQGSRILKSVYTFGDNYSCYAQSTDIALFGETQPSGLQQAIEDSTVSALSALDTRLSQDSQYQHCFDKNGNSLNCYSSNVTTSDLNYNWTDTFWKNSSCKITTNWPMELIQPELVSNPQGTCAIR